MFGGKAGGVKRDGCAGPGMCCGGLPRPARARAAGKLFGLSRISHEFKAVQEWKGIEGLFHERFEFSGWSKGAEFVNDGSAAMRSRTDT